MEKNEAENQTPEQDNDCYARLMAALELGEQDIKAGRLVPYTPGFMDECEKRAREKIAQGIKPNPDVCPD